jgi:hypothetical protein
MIAQAIINPCPCPCPNLCVHSDSVKLMRWPPTTPYPVFFALYLLRYRELEKGAPFHLSDLPLTPWWLQKCMYPNLGRSIPPSP